MKRRFSKKGQEGAAAVEFALVLPLLLLLVFGGIEFGLVMFNKQVITNASREAARMGITLAKPGDTDIESTALTYTGDHLVTFDSTVTGPTVSISRPTAPKTGDFLTVTVGYHYDFLLLPDLGKLFGGSDSPGLNLAATTTMRYE